MKTPDNSPEETQATSKANGSQPKVERLGDSLYWRGDVIMARVRVNGKRTWRSTGTDKPAEARKWLAKWKSEEWMEKHGVEPKGVILHRKRVTVGELIEAYLKAGSPTRKMRQKRPATLKIEQACLKPLMLFFGNKQAAAITLAVCDQYRDWRLAGGYFADRKPEPSETRKASPRIKKGTRSVDLELTVLAGIFNLAVRRQVLPNNPLLGKPRYSVAEDIRHCREVAPTPEGLKLIEGWLRAKQEHGSADLLCFLAFTGLRIGEALRLDWEAVNWGERLLHVVREKRGITPWVPILPELEALLKGMEQRRTSHLLFPSPLDPKKMRDASAFAHRITAACKALQLDHVTPHGLRSYFVTQCRQSGLSDAVVATLIGDKSGPAIIALTYGDVRPEHLLKQAQRIRLTVQEGHPGSEIKDGPAADAPVSKAACSPDCSPVLPQVAAGSGESSFAA